MDAMTPQGQALYCNEYVENAYDFWNSVIHSGCSHLVDYILWGFWYLELKVFLGGGFIYSPTLVVIGGKWQIPYLPNTSGALQIRPEKTNALFLRIQAHSSTHPSKIQQRNRSLLDWDLRKWFITVPQNLRRIKAFRILLPTTWRFAVCLGTGHPYDANWSKQERVKVGRPTPYIGALSDVT